MIGLKLHARRSLLLAAGVISLASVLWICFGAGPYSRHSLQLNLFEKYEKTALTQSDKAQMVSPGSASNSSSHDDLLGKSNATRWCEDETLGISSKIYIVSLPYRTDRRASMDRLLTALELDWTYADATPPTDVNVQKIMSRVRELRSAMIPENEKENVQFTWPGDLLGDLSSVLDVTGADLWHPPNTAFEVEPATPKISLAPSKDTELNDAFDITAPIPLTCSTHNNVTGPSYNVSLPPYMVLTPAKVACWHSHLEVIRRIAHGKDFHASNEAACNAVGLVLEDDVDMEWDIRERLKGIWDALPEDWDIVFLGHCWSNEATNPPLKSVIPSAELARGNTATSHLAYGPSSLPPTSLHPSHAPKCTHAYALSQRGAQRLLLHLRNPPFAYSRALDQALAWLVMSGRLKSFSIVPSVVVQMKVGRSDVDGGELGIGSVWKEGLLRGVLGS